MNKNFKRYGALLAVALLLVVFCLPMVFALGKSEQSQMLFRGALGAAFLIPVLAYAIWMVYRLLSGKKKERQSGIENIIFDVGQVLVKYDWETYLGSFGFDKNKYEKIADVTFRSSTWNERDRGALEDEEYVKEMVQAAPEYEAEIREIMRRSAETISPVEYSETWVKYLKNQGYRLYILSNYGSYMLERTRDKFDFLKYMDGAVFSCDVKQIKPEAEIYKTILNRYHLNPEKSVFIDDRAENCQGARNAGIHAIQFKSFKQAAAELEKLGVK